MMPPPVTENDDGISTPTPCNNSNWFPPPPPTPLHLALHNGDSDSAENQPGRYHEHRRSFEMDDDLEQQEKMDSNGDAITLPPISPPPSQDGGRASVASFLLNLPPPPPVTDLGNDLEAPPSPPIIPPRDPKTSVTTPNSEVSISTISLIIRYFNYHWLSFHQNFADNFDY